VLPEFIATLVSGLFAGAAGYISLVVHWARLQASAADRGSMRLDRTAVGLGRGARGSASNLWRSRQLRRISDR
jgi:hypothetical protein